MMLENAENLFFFGYANHGQENPTGFFKFKDASADLKS
jgi:hypothetical protein